MSCNGCRVLRKGCNENCILRQSLTAIETAQAQANATVFVAKFFGRAGLLSFLSAVPDHQRPALFQSLLFEACGRTLNPVNGAVGLLWSGNWQLCQSAVATVLRGGAIRAISVVPAASDSDDLELGLIRSSDINDDPRWTKKLRTTPSLEVSETTTLTLESATDSASSQTNLLHLFL